MNIQMPTSTLSDITGQVSNNMTSFSSIVILLISVTLAFFIVESIISALRSKNEKTTNN